MIDVELRGVTKRFGETIAVDDVSLEVRTGEFLSLLGPSGCGKTTTLRLIAGFEEPEKGEILIRGEVVNEKPPQMRNTAMVFQKYALFPHKRVFDNVAFGLKYRKEKLSKKEIESRVEEALNLVRLSGYQRRYPHQLSGGEQQRVAMARAIVVEPDVLLLDEPLSNLDYKLRLQMRVELRQLQEKLGMTAMYVTHDQEEAFTMSDRTALMNKGRIEVVGTPREVYETPQTAFVAEFIGVPNIFHGKISLMKDDKMVIATDVGLDLYSFYQSGFAEGENVEAVVRAEKIKLSDPRKQSFNNSFIGKIVFVSFLGSKIEYKCAVGDKVLTVIYTGPVTYERNDQVRVEWNDSDCVVVPRK